MHLLFATTHLNHHTFILQVVCVITYNVEYCEGMEGIWYKYLYFWKIFFPPKKLDERIISALKELHPDILTLIEVDTGSFRSRWKNEVMFFEEGLRLKNFVELVKYPLTGWLSLFHHIPILKKQGNAIISKYKISDVKYHMLHEGTKRMVIEVTVHCPSKVTLLAAHLALGSKARKKQIEELIEMVNGISNPVILMGDFNTFNGEGEIKELLAKTHLKDRISLDKMSLPFTEPAWHPTKRLDYILTSPQIKVKKYSVLNFHFSDHLPLMIDFEVRDKTFRKK